MTEFKPEKINLSQINGGNEYKNGDGIGAAAINAPIKASAYVQALTDADNQPRVDYDGSGITTVVIEEDNGKPRFVFKNLNTARIPVDAELSATSENPVQNKVVTQALNAQKVTVDETLKMDSENPVQNKAVTEKFTNHDVKLLGLELQKATKEELDSLKAFGEITYAKKEDVPTIFVDSEKQEFISFDSDPQAQITGLVYKVNGIISEYPDKGDVNVAIENATKEKADKNSVEAVTRIDVGYLASITGNLAISLSSAIQSAFEKRPEGASRANIEFYNVPNELIYVNGVLFWELVEFQSNCNYKFTDFNNSFIAQSIKLEGVKNCDFVGLNLVVDYNGNTLSDVGFILQGCENIQFVNCTFGAEYSVPFNIVDSTDIYIENCSFLGQGINFPKDAIKITDNGTTFRWVFIENCVFSKLVGNYPVNCENITNNKSLVTISNCHFNDLTKIKNSDIKQSLLNTGRVSVTATEDEIPTKLSKLENDENFAKKSDISTIFRYKGSVNYYSELPTVGNEVGDTYNVVNAYGVYQGGTNFSWDGTSWDGLGGALDLSLFVKKTDYATTTTNGIMLATDKAKLDSVQVGANNYSLPTATGARLGGIIVGENLTVDETTGILRGNYPIVSKTKEGLMGTNDKHHIDWLYAYGGKTYHAFGEVGWVGSSDNPNEILASISYTRTGYLRGLISFSYILTAQNVGVDKWHIDISKVEELLREIKNANGVAELGTLRFARPTNPEDKNTWLVGGMWSRQGEQVQATPHTKARVCVMTPYCFLPAYYFKNAEGKVTLGTVGTASFVENGIVQLWNIPVEEA